jgi:hypothetical protein
MTISGTWTVQFAGCKVTIAWRGDAAPAILEFLFGPPNGTDADSVAEHFQFIADTGQQQFEIFQGARSIYADASAGTTAGVLLDKVVTELAGACLMGPVFHAGALVTKSGSGLLLPGKSGAGKSTLAATLAQRGWRYLTDELVCIAAGSDTIQGFARPIHLKHPADGIFAHLCTASDRQISPAPDGCMISAQGLLIDAALLNSLCHGGPSPAGLIVFPQFVPEAACHIEPLTPALACARLMGAVVNARNLHGHGLEEISRIVRRVPAYAMRFGDLEHGVQSIDDLAVSLIPEISPSLR